MLQMQSKGEDGVSITIDLARLNIGRDPGNDLVLNDAGGSCYHASIFFENGFTELIDLGSTNGTFVNGQRIAERHELKAWDTVRIGKSEFELVDPAGRLPTMVQSAVPITPCENHTSLPKTPKKSNAAEPAFADLKLISAGVYPHCLPIKCKTTIGRGAGNSLTLQSPSVSVRHAEIVMEGGELVLKDLHSTKGTYVNGRRVTRQGLRHGDVLRFDEVEYRIELTDTDGGAKTMVNPALYSENSAIVVNPAAGGIVSGRLAHVLPPKQPAFYAQKTVLETPARRPAGPATNPVPSSVSAEAIPYSTAGPVPVSQPTTSPSSYEYSQAPIRTTDNPCSGFLWFFFSIEGRINRIKDLLGGLATSALICLAVFVILPVIIGSIAFGSLSVIGFEIIVTYIAIFVLWGWLDASLAAKRLHDMNQSAHFLWIFLLPTAWIIMPFVLLFRGGTSRRIDMVHLPNNFFS